MSCQCCGTVMEGPADEWEYSICRECSWEQDSLASAYPDDDCNPNNISLVEAKKNYADFGACDSHGLWMKTGKYPKGLN